MSPALLASEVTSPTMSGYWFFLPLLTNLHKVLIFMELVGKFLGTWNLQSSDRNKIDLWGAGGWLLFLDARVVSA